MPQGVDNIRHVYPSPGTMCVILINPVLRKHVETVRRRYAEASWTRDARIDPNNHNIIIVTHDPDDYTGELQTRS